MSKVDSRLNKLMINFIDGIPIDLAVKLIDFKTKLNPFIFLNLVLPSILSKKSKTGNSKIKITKKQSKAVLIKSSSKLDSTTSKKGPIIANGPVITINVVDR